MIFSGFWKEGFLGKIIRKKGVLKLVMIFFKNKDS